MDFHEFPVVVPGLRPRQRRLGVFRGQSGVVGSDYFDAETGRRRTTDVLRTTDVGMSCATCKLLVTIRRVGRKYRNPKTDSRERGCAYRPLGGPVLPPVARAFRLFRSNGVVGQHGFFGSDARKALYPGRIGR